MTGKKIWVLGLLVILSAFIVYTSYQQKIKSLPEGNMTTLKNHLDYPSTDSVTPIPIPGRPQVEFSTSKGSFTVELRPDLAPQTVANFLKKWNAGDCDGLTFHRVEDWVVQGCDPLGNGTGGGDTLPTETSSQTFSAGSLGVARKAYPKDISNDSQIFITKKDSDFLDNDYTYFGHVISGMSVIDSLIAGDKIISTSLLTK